MPSSMIFLGLVVVWLLILVPAVARHRQEVARPGSAALSGRVLDRPPRARVRRRDRRAPVGAREQEVDVTEHDEQPRSVAVADGERARPAERDDRDWQRPPPRYRPGRGGFDPEAAALAAQARYAFRQRVVLAMLVSVVATALLAGFLLPWLWWAHAGVDLALVCYLVYLRRQVRVEETIRARRAARMAGTRRTSAAEDPELDEWARRGRAASGTARTDRQPRADDADDHVDDRADDDAVEDEAECDDEADDVDDTPDTDPDDDLNREPPERIAGTGAPLWRGPGPGLEMMEVETALPRIQPIPPPPLPAGTSLVEVDPDDPELHDLDGPLRPDYRRAAGE